MRAITPMAGPSVFRGLVLSLGLLCLIGMPAGAADLRITGARVYSSPGAPALVDATVVVRDGVIAAVGPSGTIVADPSARVIPGDGLVVVAGLWNSHVHLLLPAMARPAAENAAALSSEIEAMFTRWGFTTIFDIGSLPGVAIELRRRIARGELRGPSILTVDAPFFPNGAHRSTCARCWRACPRWRSERPQAPPRRRGGGSKPAPMA